MKLNLPTVIKVQAGIGGFAEDKDAARKIRVESILPALEGNEKIVLDFGDAKYSTQSFVHALVGEALQRFGESALDKLEFRNCTPQLKSLIRLVADYSLGGFRTEQGKPADAGNAGNATRETRVKNPRRRRSA